MDILLKIMTGYSELQVTTNFSFLRGASHPEEMVQQAVQYGYTKLAITDRNTLAGVVRDIFATALLNSMPMGFYQPAQIVIDARNHGVGVRGVDINYSQWDNLLEEKSGAYFAIRLVFRQIKAFVRKMHMPYYRQERLPILLFL